MSCYLWRSGWQNAMKAAIEWVKTWAEVTNVVISRCDLAADFECKLPVFSPDFRELVTRARKKDTHLERYNDGLKLTGYSVGSPMLMCRIYDKLHELKRSDKAWFKELWLKNGWKEDSPVMRVEFQIRRTLLRGMQVNTPTDLEAQVADLFKYTSTDWLTIRNEQSDTHRTRWPINSLWLAVQSATEQFGQLTGVSRLGQMRPRYNHLKAQMRGSLVSLVAISSESLNASDNKVAIAQVRTLVRSLTARSEFDTDVAQRRARFAGMDTRR
jgi:hypothetical protein